MTITEESRHRMYQRLEELLGHDEATKLMDHLPPVGWADVATRRDIDHLAATTKRDGEGLAASLKHDIEGWRAATKHEIEALRVATKHDMDSHRAATKNDIDNLAASTRHDVENLGNVLRIEVACGQRNLLLAMLASQSALVGLTFAAAQLI